MKKYFILILITFIINQKASAQGAINKIQEFIDATLQIPYMAKVANVQGVVRVRITMGQDNLPQKFEIKDSLRLDCNLEAIRVAKLLNIQNLQELLAGKKRAVIEFPFNNTEFFSFKEGIQTNYFDETKKPTLEVEKVKFAEAFPVDTLTGIPNGNKGYFKLEKGTLKAKNEYGILRIDSLEKYKPEFLENPADSMKIYKFNFLTNSDIESSKYYYYANGQIKVKNRGDDFLKYYPNGRINSLFQKLEATKEKTTEWFANGQKSRVYLKTQISGKPSETTLISSWNFEGKPLVVDGEGLDEYFEFQNDTSFINRGNYKNGKKEGLWIGEKEGFVIYKEIHKQGELIKGTSFSKIDSVNYTEDEIQAEFKDGMRSMYKFLGVNIKYPVEAQKNYIEGKVFMQFVVCTDGTICDFKLLKGIGKECDEEASRVLKLSSGNWTPGMHRGRPVRSRFTVPVSFVLE